jgi:tetratricopeptide (TPR) repeat protein
MSPENARLQRALQLHRGGLIDEAKSIYHELLSADPVNADVIGLLGMIAFQKNDRAGAERSWKQSLSLPSTPWVIVRDMNNLLTTLLETSRYDEAKSILQRTNIPQWGRAEGPDQRQLKSIVSLVLCLGGLGFAKEARRLLESVSAKLEESNETLRLLAQLRLDDKDFGPALDALGKLEGPDDLWILTARLKCEDELGLHAERRIDHDKLLQLAPTHINHSAQHRGRTILVINSSAYLPVTGSTFDLHFHHNFPAQIANRLGDRFNFISAFPDSSNLDKDALRPQLVLNNIVNGEILSGAGGEKLKRDLTEFANHFRVPVINHPTRAALATRQRLAFSLRDLNNVVTPKTMRFIALEKEIDSQTHALERGLNYPLIIRTTTAQAGIGMEKITDQSELRRELRARNGREIYVHAFVENRGEFGLYRKFRAGIVGDEIIPFWVDFSEDWKVGGRLAPARKTFYRQRRELRKVERTLMSVPNPVLSHQVLRTLADIRKRVPLDMFGIDFDVMPDGRVLFFEANATMLFYGTLGPEDADIDRPAGPSARLDAAVSAFLQRKLDS